MSEAAAFRTVQIGKETTFGTAVAATLIFPVDSGSGEFTTNRAYDIPNEDFGGIGQHLAGRGSFGVRQATSSLTLSAASFELLPHLLQMAIGTPVTSGTASPYTHTFTADWSSDTSKSYTWEVDATVQDWIARGVLVTRFDLGFDTIQAGQNAMWTFNADLVAPDSTKGTATGSLSAPTTIQTIEGHLSQVYEGPSGTAYASLSELTSSLVSYRLTVECPKVLQPYGGTVDYAESWHSNKRIVTATGSMVVSSSVVTDFWDIFNVSGALPTDRRMRVKASGSNSATLTIDHLLEYTDTHIEPDGRDGERLVSWTANALYDSTNATDLVIAIDNGTSSY